MTPWVLRLLIANIVMFLVAQPNTPLYYHLAFIPDLVLQRPWTFVTYMFLHAGIWHLVFNMIGLYFFGPRLEARIGSRDFVILYLLAGISGALVSIPIGSPIVGASGGVFGILLGFARYWPHERIYLWAVLPIPARLMVIGLTLLSLYSGFSGASSGIAHFAHLGGFAGAWVFLKLRERRTGSFRRKATKGADPSALDRISGRAAREEKRWESIRLEDLHEINRHEVERIRAKIRAQGSGSLTPEERAFMNRMIAD